MAKCISCGKGFGLFGGKKKVEIAYGNETVCEDCARKAGYTLEDLASKQLSWMSWRQLKKGKTAVLEEIEKERYEREHKKEKKFNITGDGVNDAGEDLQIVLKRIGQDYTDDDDLFGGYTIADMKEEGDEKTRYIYAYSHIPCGLKLEGDTVKAYVDGDHVADLPKAVSLVKKHPDAEARLIITGGKFRKVSYDYDTEKYVNDSGEIDFDGMIIVTYIE